MDPSHSHPGSPDTVTPVSRWSIASINLSSPTASVFSRGHSSKGSSSSITSSPTLRDSIDMYGTAKRLEDVTEEPQERDEFAGCTLIDDCYDFIDYNKAFADSDDHITPPVSPTQPEWSLADHDDWSFPPSTQPLSKRPRSMGHPVRQTSPHRFSGRMNSISRRWRNRSAAGPQLSIVTHLHSPVSRPGSFNGSQILSPALSVISRHESSISHSPVQAMASCSSLDLETRPIDIDHQPAEDNDEEAGQATTPLLPPIMFDMFKREDPIHSPLQSPAIAPTSTVVSSRTSLEYTFSCLPSPPLSTRPSMASMHNRSRTSTITGEIPPFQLLDDSCDPWSVKLGHANFSIHPEPYVPETVTLDSYAEFRNNWDQARTKYAKHLARTAEHNGSTSKVYKLTEEKWTAIDNQWKRQHNLMRKALAPVLARLSDGDSDMTDSAATGAVLEKPMTKVILPVIDDKSGKFPELGDMEIVGPMSVARPRAMTEPFRRGDPRSTHKRNLFKFLTDLIRN